MIGDLHGLIYVIANEKWCLGLFLPLLIGEFIAEDDDHWTAYCTLLEIVCIVFSPLISKLQMPYLQVLSISYMMYFNTVNIYRHRNLCWKSRVLQFASAVIFCICRNLCVSVSIFYPAIFIVHTLL
jgi:hypothetical protein